MKIEALIRLFLVVLLVFMSSLAATAEPASANGDAALAPSYSFTLQGDVTSAGIGLRASSFGDIVIADIPLGANVYRAYLYWATLGNVNTYTSPTLDGEYVQGDLIGTSGDTCWNVQNNFVYRADVTSLVSGNGTYRVAGLPHDLALGNDTQGASLVVIYEDSSLPFRTILVNDGAVTLDFIQESYSHTITGFNPDVPLADAHITYLIGDGQATWDAGNVIFNGQSIASGIFSGADGDYWGTHTFDVTHLVSNPSITTTINNYDPGNPDSPDCLLWAGTIFSTTIELPDESTNQLSNFTRHTLFGDVVADGIGLRGVGEGEILISGIPGNAVVKNAYLYWATIGNSGKYISPTIEDQVVDGQLIGVSEDTCWGALHNYVYRADVSAIVKGNGSYTIAGLPRNLAAGNDSQGASLVIIYAAPGLYRTIVINEGAVTLDIDQNTYMDTLSGFTADQPGAQGSITYLVGDGQSQWDNGNVSFEGYSIASNVFNGVDGDFWGTLSFDVTGLISEPTAMTIINNHDPSNPDSPDCLLWAATVFSVETEPPVFDEILYIPFAVR